MREKERARLWALAAPVALALAAQATAAGQEPTYPRGKYARYTLILKGASEDGGPLSIHLHSRDHNLTSGWATTPSSGGTVVEHDLRRQDNAVAGRVRAIVGPVEYRYAIRADVQGRSLSGDYEGAYGIKAWQENLRGDVSGDLQARAAPSLAVRFELDFASLYTRQGHIRHPSVRFTLREGKAGDGRFFSRTQGKRGFTGRFDGGELKFDGRRLSGTLRATVVGGDAARGTYTFEVDGTARCNFVAGTVTTRKDGADWGTRPLYGTARGARTGQATDGVYVLTLSKALEGSRPLKLFVDCRDGSFHRGLARGGNVKTHTVGATGLSLVAGRFSARVAVEIVPDERFPPGGRTVSCEYVIDARLSGSNLRGTFNGRYGKRRPAEGKVTGSVRTDEDFLGAASSPRPAAQADWPSYLGPNGNFSESSRTGLLDDVSQARLVWMSEERRIGHAKAASWYGRDDRMYGDLPPGGAASLIVAGGLVIASYHVPSGEVWDTFVEELHQKGGREFQRHKWLIEADDVVLAVDAATGRTRWKQIFARKGMNHGGGKRPRSGMTPMAAGGRVFAVGTTGRLYALALDSGKVLWEGTIGPRHAELEKLKAKGLAERRIHAAHLLNGLLVADGVLVVPDGASGLGGVDLEGGKRLWQLNDALSGFNMPCPVRVKGKPYVACVNRSGKLRLVRPKTGEVLWTVELKCEHLTQPVATDDHLLIFEPNPTYGGDKGRGVNRYGVLAAYRFDESGATRDWALPGKYIHELHLDGGPSRRVIPRDGLVYYLNWTSHPQRERRLLIIRESDGSVLADQRIEQDQFYVWGKGLVLVADNQHDSLRPAIYQAANPDPAKFGLLGKPWQPRAFVPGRIGTCGYEVPIYDPFVDGFMFCRTGNGDILCYDLGAREMAR